MILKPTIHLGIWALVILLAPFLPAVALGGAPWEVQQYWVPAVDVDVEALRMAGGTVVGRRGSLEVVVAPLQTPNLSWLRSERIPAPGQRMDKKLERMLHEAAPRAEVMAHFRAISVVGLDLVTVKKRCETLGIRVRSEAFRVDRTLTAVGTREEWLSLEREGWIRVIYPQRNPVPFNADAADSIQVEKLWPGGESGLDLTGEGVVLGIIDGGGVDVRHADFQGRVRNLGAEYIDNCEPVSSHATSVGGTMVGAGLGDSNATGMAYGARMLLGWPFCGDPVDNTAIAGMVSSASNHSYGYSAGWHFDSNSHDWVWLGDEWFGKYISEARSADVLAREIDHIWVKAAGNEAGNGPDNPPEDQPKDCPNGRDCLSPDATSKNIILVGAIKDSEEDPQMPRDIKIWGASSSGPTDDGRIKPDIVANGTGVFTATSGADSGYSENSGTSLSSPTVTGGVGLLLELYGSFQSSTIPRAAEMKALLVFGANSKKAEGRPHARFGHGVADFAKSAQVIQDTFGEGIQRMVYHAQPGGEAVHSYQVNVEEGDEIWLTLAWMDPAGEPNNEGKNDTTAVLVNDLDMRLVRQDGEVFYPWHFQVGDMQGDAVRDTPNRRDNVERLVHFGATEGTWTVEVSVEGSLFEGDAQPYSLVSSHALLPVEAIPPLLQSGRVIPILIDGNEPIVEDIPLGVWGEGEMAFHLEADTPDWLELSSAGGVLPGVLPTITVDPNLVSKDMKMEKVTLWVTSSDAPHHPARPITVAVFPDNCPDVENPLQMDSDGDGQGDQCDNCTYLPNIDQLDDDEDGVGNACDWCPGTADELQVDSDGDHIGDACDNCPFHANVTQWDSDEDGVGNQCQDSDEDGYPEGPVEGLSVFYWGGVDPSSLPDFELLGTPHATGIRPHIIYGSTGGVVFGNPLGLAENIAIQYRGVIDVPADSKYQFWITSDDGSRLFIDGELVVTNDFLHPPETKEGGVWLDQGVHAIRVDFFEHYGGAALWLEWADRAFMNRHLVTAKEFAPVDNCPHVYNPYQRDSDHNGMGDACDLNGNGQDDGEEDFSYHGVLVPSPPSESSTPVLDEDVFSAPGDVADGDMQEEQGEEADTSDSENSPSGIEEDASSDDGGCRTNTEPLFGTWMAFVLVLFYGWRRRQSAPSVTAAP